MLFLKGATRPAAHIDEVLVVHLHNVVQQRLSRLSQKTGDKRQAYSAIAGLYRQFELVTLAHRREMAHAWM